MNSTNKNENYIPKMRTINGAIEELKKLDPNTAFTAHALRMAINKGDIPRVLAGNKNLVDMNDVTSYLSA